LWGFPRTIAREIRTLTRKLLEEPMGAEEEQERLGGKFVIMSSRRDGVPEGDIWVGKFTNRVEPMELQNAFAAMPGFLLTRIQNLKRKYSVLKVLFWGTSKSYLTILRIPANQFCPMILPYRFGRQTWPKKNKQLDPVIAGKVDDTSLARTF